MNLGIDHPDHKLYLERPLRGDVFVARARRGLLWVGWSNAPTKTLKTIQCYSPEAVHMIFRHAASPRQVRDIHQALQGERVRAESCWFRPTATTLAVLGRVGVTSASLMTTPT